MRRVERDFETFMAILFGPFILAWKAFKLIRRLWRNERRVIEYHKLKSPEWKREWRQLRYDFARFTKRHGFYFCHACGCIKGPFQIDHIEPKSLRPDLSLCWTNLQVLCGCRNVGGCNQSKGNTDNIDWRPPVARNAIERNRKMVRKWPAGQSVAGAVSTKLTA